MTVSPQNTVIESHYPFSAIYIHSCDSSCFSLSVPPILSILYLRYQHGRPPPVVTIVPTEGESLLYLRYFIYAYMFLLCRYPTYNRLVLLRIPVVTIVPTEDILLTIGYGPRRSLNNLLSRDDRTYPNPDKSYSKRRVDYPYTLPCRQEYHP